MGLSPDTVFKGDAPGEIAERTFSKVATSGSRPPHVIVENVSLDLHSTDLNYILAANPFTAQRSRSVFDHLLLIKASETF